jgi:hypothetical protein
MLMIVLAAAFTALPAALAAGTRVDASRFIVSVRATVTQQWTYTTSTKSAGCTSRISAAGTRTFSLRSSDVSPIAMRWSGGASRARFGGRIAVAGSIAQSGTKTTRVTGTSGCDVGTHRLTCRRLRAAIAGRNLGILSRRRHRMSLTALRAVVPQSFYTDCPGEPAPFRRLSNGLEVADAGYSERALATPSTGGLNVQGGATVTTEFFSPPGRVVQKINFTLLFRRVG